VLTDPPYFANVQYAELMDFCYVWLRRQLAAEVPAFRAPTTRAADELTVNQTLQRDASHYAEGMSRVFRRFADALKPGAPFAFTFHHNRVEAYTPIAVALLDAGLACTASLAAPAEMGASIHINGTGSSVLDTVFVCRSHGRVPAPDFEPDEENLRRLLDRDARQLADGGVSLTQGDFRCLLLGHLTRLVIWAMRPGWDEDAPVERKLARVQAAFFEVLTPEQFERLAVKMVADRTPVREAPPLFASLEPVGAFDDAPELSF